MKYGNTNVSANPNIRESVDYVGMAPTGHAHFPK